VLIKPYNKHLLEGLESIHFFHLNSNFPVHYLIKLFATFRTNSTFNFCNRDIKKQIFSKEQNVSSIEVLG
jgi:hypothetical protein